MRIDQGKTRLLVMEDTPSDRALIRMAFHDCDTQIDMAVNGQEGVRHFQKNDYEVIITDIQMPGLDGLEATREIRRIERTRPGRHRVWIIGCTAGTPGVTECGCLRAGIDVFFQKPINLAGLRRTVSVLLGRHITNS